MVSKQANAALDCKEDKGSSYTRTKMTKIDMGLAQSTVLHIAEHFKGRITNSHTISCRPLDFDQMVSFYPNASKMAVLFEMGDHLTDFLTDIRNEVEYGIATPNWITTKKLHQK